ncbi:hypothetical protein CHS0354_016474 [Potamilus streckersoni]|uniref:non-specific serine/threonine protein kinase n=1 Tax=Potamilus streckersoni TaxID=2493646 RepID=A0AAE0TJD9_9BIVA|nr:hypothetical protein CHS0354_016474 [Potamilus streckersoni]
MINIRELRINDSLDRAVICVISLQLDWTLFRLDIVHWKLDTSYRAMSTGHSNDVLETRYLVDKEGPLTESEMPLSEQVTKDSDKERSRTEEDVPSPDHVFNDSKDDKEDPIIPVEILRMNDRSIQLYRKALQDGVEKVFSIRVMVVGQYGVGKTTLIKRLLGHQVDISERNSTEGIDVHTHCCKIPLNTGEWIVEHEDSDQLTRLKRLRELLSGLDQNPDVSQEQESNIEGIYQRETTSEVHTANNSDTSVLSVADQDIQLTFSQPEKLSLFKVNGEMHSGQESNNVAVPEREVKTNESEKKKDAVMEIFHLINENADKLGKDIVKYAALSVWDFAGQYAFYTTHQTFLTSRALYLLVIDLNQQITDPIKDDKCFLDTDGTKLCKVYDLIEIWLNSILSCAPSSKASIPNVILVGTHVDKIPEKSRKEVIDKYFRKLRYMLREKPTIRHLVDDIAIDNTQHDPMMEELKRRIFELSSKQPHWGEEKPARWIPLEQALMTLKASGAKVVPLSLIEDINMSGSVRIEDRNELELFLRFHHEMGTILYFSVDGLREKIVLDPQWMIDALKSLVTAESFVRKIPAFTSKLYEFIETGKLTHELIDTIWTKENNLEFHDNKEHILQLMEQLNIIARPKFYIEEGKELKEENYFLAPCMLQQKTPDDVICPKPNDQMESSPVMCYVFMGKFLPCPIFHRLIAACVAHWPIATKKKEETEDKLIFCGCCVFQLDQYHKLTLFFREYVIFMRVTRMGIREKTPSSKLCIAAKTFVTTNLVKIIGYLGQSLTFEYFIQCPEYNGVSINSLIPVSLLKENAEVCCDLHDNIIESSRLLNFWFEDQKQVDVAGTVVQARLKMAQTKMGATRTKSKLYLPVRKPRITAVQRSGQLPAKLEKPKAKIQATAASDKKETPHRIALNRCLSTLVRELDFKLVSMYIQEKELFDDVTMRDISDQKTTSNQIRELIKRIQQRDQDTYEKFKECLIQARQSFLRDMLEKEDAKLLQK